MFNSLGSSIGFLFGVVLTVGLLLKPHLLPGAWGYKAGYTLPLPVVIIVLIGAFAVMAVTLWITERLVDDERSWKSSRVIAGTVLIAVVATALYSLLVELFAMKSGMRALIAVLGVPVMYGKQVASIGRKSLKQAMLDIFSGALTTVGAAYIVAALIRGW